MCDCWQCNMTESELAEFEAAAEGELMPKGFKTVSELIQDVQDECSPEKWYFTFGQGHEAPNGRPLKDYVVEIVGTYSEAREKMVEIAGDKWAFQYHSPMEAGVGKWYKPEMVITAAQLNEILGEV